MYMNPAIAGSDPWMNTQLTDLANPTKAGSGFQFGATEAALQGGITQQHKDEAKEAGLRHAKYALQGMAKLPKWQSPPLTYRGRSETPAKIASDYQVNQTINFTAFASSSTKQSVAVNFATGNVNATNPVPLLIILTVTNGRDIAKLSLFPGEGEILLLPGASFTITQSAPGTVGGMPGHIVHAVQTI
jgi:hypothetical protein